MYVKFYNKQFHSYHGLSHWTTIIIKWYHTRLSEWLRTNKLCPNVNKTKLMIFNQRNHTLPQIYFNNSLLEWVPNFKYLGVFIDNRLSFTTHATFLTKKLSSVLGIMYSSKQFLNTKALLTIQGVFFMRTNFYHW